MTSGHQAPIILITAIFSETEDVLAGFEAGSNDYVIRPCDNREIQARIRANLPPGIVEINGRFRIDFDALHVFVRSDETWQEVCLQPLLFRLLQVLVLNAGQIIEATRLKDRVWDKEISDDALAVFIRRLREKLEPDPHHPTYIETIRGVGYRFNGRPSRAGSKRAAAEDAMLINWLTGYGPSNLEALVFLIVLGTLTFVGFRRSRRRWQEEARQGQAFLVEAQRQNEQLQDELAEVRALYDPVRIRSLQEHLQRLIAHEFVKGLHFILSQSDETVARLRADQADLRDRQNQVSAKAHEMIQHARNIVEFPDLERNAAQREMVNLRGLLEGILKELFPYAEARGVHLRDQIWQPGANLDQQTTGHANVSQRHPQRYPLFA